MSSAASSSLTEHERDWLLKMPCWSTVRGAEVLAKFERLEADNERLRRRVDAAHAEGLMDAAEAMTPRG